MTDGARCLWIGGATGSGKSTAARLLARRHGLRYHGTDTTTWSHRDRAVAEGDGSARAWDELTPQQRTALPATDQAALDLDRSRYLLDDVAALPDHPPVVVEGSVVVPSVVPSGSVTVWLTARPEVRAARTRTRGWGLAGGAAERIRATALHQQLCATPSVIVDTTGHAGPADTLLALEAVVGPWFSAHPGVTDPAACRRLRREVNRALVGQYRTGWRRSGLLPDPYLVRALECECDEPDCTAFVETTIAALPDPFDLGSPPVLGDGHR